jgi:phosphate:Na+ symporter
MRESEALAAFLGLLDNAWPVATLISAGLAFASSSSLAIVMLVLSLSSAGVLTAGLTVLISTSTLPGPRPDSKPSGP